MPDSIIHRGFAETPLGQIHYAEAGRGKPVLLLHQTPRSWDEYRDVLPLLGRRFRSLAMDTVGFGESYKPPRVDSIEEYAKGVIAFLDALGIKRASLVGHHTGGVIAVEVAAASPDRVDRLVLSSTPYVDAEDRERRKTRPPIDRVEPRGDGAHLQELWQRRMGFYPADRPDLLVRFVIDALKIGDRVEAGHEAVGRYCMESRVSLIRAPTLVLAGSDDPFSLPNLRPLADRIAGSETAVIDGGMVPMVDQMPERFAEVVGEFLGRA